jgi:hypothetical protein
MTGPSSFGYGSTTADYDRWFTDSVRQLLLPAAR